MPYRTVNQLLILSCLSLNILGCTQWSVEDRQRHDYVTRMGDADAPGKLDYAALEKETADSIGR